MLTSMAARQGPVSALPKQNLKGLNRAPITPPIETGHSHGLILDGAE